MKPSPGQTEVTVWFDSPFDKIIQMMANMKEGKSDLKKRYEERKPVPLYKINLTEEEYAEFLKLLENLLAASIQRETT